jgi:hypothetical protein
VHLAQGLARQENFRELRRGESAALTVSTPGQSASGARTSIKASKIRARKKQIIADQSLGFLLRDHQITDEAALGGACVNPHAPRQTQDERRQKGGQLQILSTVERAFRYIKSVD